MCAPTASENGRLCDLYSRLTLHGSISSFSLSLSSPSHLFRVHVYMLSRRFGSKKKIESFYKVCPSHLLMFSICVDRHRSCVWTKRHFRFIFLESLLFSLSLSSLFFFFFSSFDVRATPLFSLQVVEPDYYAERLREFMNSKITGEDKGKPAVQRSATVPV